MNMWILILVYQSFASHGCAAISVPFHSEKACIEAAKVAQKENFDRAFCVSDK